MNDMMPIDAERLKDRIRQFYCYDYDSLLICSFINDYAEIVDPETLQLVKELREKLARYEQAEKDGILIQLPVKPGEFVRLKDDLDDKPVRVDCIQIYADDRVKFVFHDFGVRQRFVDEWIEDAPENYVVAETPLKHGFYRQMKQKVY